MGKLFLFPKICLYFIFAYLNVTVILKGVKGNISIALEALSHALPVYSIIRVSFYQMAEMHHKSIIVLRMFRQNLAISGNDMESERLRRSYLEKIVRCLTQIQFSASDVYGIRWHTTLSFFYAVTCNTITIFIGTKNRI
jgi:hypothetical protein